MSLGTPLSCNSPCVLIIQVIIILIEGNLRGRCRTFKLNRIACFLVLLLIKSAEGINVAWPRDSWEVAFTLAIELELALDLLNNHLLESQDVEVFVGVDLSFLGLLGRLVRV